MEATKNPDPVSEGKPTSNESEAQAAGLNKAGQDAE
jgi:hypothetical protein